jgi:hypothetical protein
MRFLSGLTARSQQLARRIVVRVALGGACALSGAIGLGFATHALYHALRLQYGVIDASIGLCAIYLVLAGVLYLCYRRVGAPAPARLSQGLASDAEALKAAAAQASDAPQAAALAMGLELAKEMTPLQLTMIAVISGFVAGRRL